MLRTVTATLLPLLPSLQRIPWVYHLRLQRVLQLLSSAQHSRRALDGLQSISGYWLPLATSHPTAEVATQAPATPSDEVGMAGSAALAGGNAGAAETKRCRLTVQSKARGGSHEGSHECTL